MANGEKLSFSHKILRVLEIQQLPYSQFQSLISFIPSINIGTSMPPYISYKLSQNIRFQDFSKP